MLPPFELEQYLLKHEHKAHLSLYSSGLESMPLAELLTLAGPDYLTMFNNTSLDYSSPQGSEPLRQEIAMQYQEASPEDVCVFAGAAEGILCTLQGFLTADDHAVVVTPCYQSLYSVPASRCEVTAVSLDEASGWQLELDKVQAALRPNTKLIVINFPNNPTGALPERVIIAELIEMARKRGIYIFSDEVYRLMEIDPTNCLPPMADLYERGISISSMSKAYGLPGLRIGWLTSQAPQVISSAINLKHYTSICPNSASEVLASIALRIGNRILERNLQVMRSNLDLVDRFIERVEDKCRWVKPRGGCLGFPRLLIPETAENLSQRLLEQERVMILPGSLYGRYDSHFRLGFGRRDFAEALVQLERVLKEYSCL
jgi:aspartate/methionine/tyrosine aminotransferase